MHHVPSTVTHRKLTRKVLGADLLLPSEPCHDSPDWQLSVVTAKSRQRRLTDESEPCLDCAFSDLSNPQTVPRQTPRFNNATLEGHANRTPQPSHVMHCNMLVSTGHAMTRQGHAGALQRTAACQTAEEPHADVSVGTLPNGDDCAQIFLVGASATSVKQKLAQGGFT